MPTDADQISKEFGCYTGFSTQFYPGMKSSHQLACLFEGYRKIHLLLLQAFGAIFMVDCNSLQLAPPKLIMFRRNLSGLEFCLQKSWVSVSRSSYISDINVLDKFPFDWFNSALLQTLIILVKSLPLRSNTISGLVSLYLEHNFLTSETEVRVCLYAIGGNYIRISLLGSF